jgi:hypothetical protein
VNPGTLFIEFLYGMLGAGYFIYGRKAGRMRFMVCGAGLGVFPYFVDPLWAIVLAGALLAALPFLIRGD